MRSQVRRSITGVLTVMLAFAVAGGPLFGQKKKDRDEDARSRTVEGSVRDQNDNLIEGAVVKLKNMKTLQVRSFITDENGAYRFHGLETDVDYKLQAEHGGRSSRERTLSVFDSRRKAIINLTLE
jgi:hypothetical protein